MALSQTMTHSRRALLVLCAVLCLLLGPVSGQMGALQKPASEQPNKRPPLRRAAHAEWTSVVYRADSRSPRVIRAAGGILPPLATRPQFDDAFSLYSHALAEDAQHDDVRETVYVSTTRDFQQAANAAAQLANGGWVYSIYPSPNMIDVADSLLGRTPVGHNAEVVAVGGIRWSQVLSYVFVGHGKEPETVSQDPDKDGFVSNEDFDEAWLDLGASEGQPQLAGLCGPKAPRMDDESFCEKPTQKHVEEFMATLSPAVGWGGHWPLFGPPEVAHNMVEARAVKLCQQEPCPDEDPDAPGRRVDIALNGQPVI